MDLQLLGALTFALKHLAKALFKLLFPLADLGGSDVVFAGDLGCGLLALEGFQG
ncbi:MAG: hypothetical protein GXX91_11105, partial [Verrucomicrobiaceae bacterium]|nr:hypothetical protein [Verrucomicrobiaceae bacterium]